MRGYCFWMYEKHTQILYFSTLVIWYFEHHCSKIMSVVRLGWHEIYQRMFFKKIAAFPKILNHWKYGKAFLHLAVVTAFHLASYFDLFGFECFFCFVWIFDFPCYLWEVKIYIRHTQNVRYQFNIGDLYSKWVFVSTATKVADGET